MNKAKLPIIVLCLVIFICTTCACSKRTENDDSASFCYGCSSYSIAPTDGYGQDVNANIYYEGFYYLVVYGYKLDDSCDGPDNYYTLHKIDSDGNEVNVISLPVECVSTSNQIIVNDKLYCVGINNNEYVIDIDSGNIISQEISNSNTRGYYSIENGYVKITVNDAICYSNEAVEEGRIDIRELGNLNNSKPFYEQDGKYYLVKDNINNVVFYELDFTRNCIDEVFVSDVLSSGVATISGDVIFSYGGVYSVNCEGGVLIPITDWNYVDVKPAYKATIYEKNLSYTDKRFGKLYIYKDYEIELIIFNRLSSNIYSDRIMITVGGYNVSSSHSVKWAAYRFNTSQDQYRVCIDEYWEKYPYSTGSEAQAQMDSLLRFINDGNSPDIYFGTNFDYRYMYNAGLVVDMLPLIEGDSNFDVDDLLPSIKNTIIKDGVCYQIFSSFTLNGYFGLRDTFVDSNVTYSSIDELAQERGISIRGDIQSAELADQILRYSLDTLVDRASGDHILTLDELQNVVEFSIRNGIPYYSFENSIADMETVHDGVYLICRRLMGNLYELSYVEDKLDDSFVYLGFPSVYGSVHVAEPDGLVAISADTRYQDACWEFVRFMLSDEIQILEIGQNQTPVVKTVFDDFCEYAATPEMVPADDDRWNSIFIGKDAVPEWIIMDYRDIVNSIDSVLSYDWGLYVLICEEINAYDSQGKDIDAIAESLQSRLDLYVSENYGL